MVDSRKVPAVRHGYAEVVTYLRDLIRRGEVKPGERLPSFIQVQALLGTTPNTVNRALIDLEQDGLITREKRRGIFVATPQSPRRHALGLVAFSSPNTSSPYYSLLISGMEEVAARADYELTLLKPDSIRGLDRVDGVLIHGEAAGSYFDMLPPGTPFVSVMNPFASVSSVGIDDFAAGHSATEHLLGLGHRRIGFSGHLDSPITQRRLSGYENALRTGRVTPDPAWARTYVPHEMAELPKAQTVQRMFELGYHGGKQWLDDNWRELGLTALVVQNDEFAIGFMRALQDGGYKVPGDISVIGFDSTGICDLCTPRLTSMRLPLAAIGAEATERLLKQIREEAGPPVTTLLPVQIDIRESTGPVPGV